MDIIKVFAHNVKKYRTLIGLSQEAFAEKAGLHRTYISAIEREKKKYSFRKCPKNCRCTRCGNIFIIYR